MSESILVVSHLRKAYGSTIAVDGICFSVDRGEIVGLLGPNGAGKTTTISMICGLTVPTDGRVTVSGHDIAAEAIAAKSQIGLVPQDIALYEELSATANLSFWGSLQGLTGQSLRSRVAELLEKVDLEGRATEPVERFSGGMKRRLNLAVGLIAHPHLLLLDEPTVGIDPQARFAILDIVREEARAGTAVLYTTHLLEEAERLCDRILIIDRGTIHAEGSPESLVAMLGEGKVVTIRGPFEQGSIDPLLVTEDGMEIVSSQAGRVLLSIENGAIPALFELLSRDEVSVDDISVREPDLESVFIKLTGRQLRD
ncbi:MAG: export ABC transporter ATP-binding protein [Gemmatimonadetes bacterium]|nr:export ABC transporter ATP-binding protein [Gemmatimonadota bacterium]